MKTTALLSLLTLTLTLMACTATVDQKAPSAVTLIDHLPIVSTPGQVYLGDLSASQTLVGDTLTVGVSIGVRVAHEVVHVALALPLDCFYPLENNAQYIPETTWERVPAHSALTAQFRFVRVASCKNTGGTLDYQFSTRHDGVDDHTALRLKL